MEIFNSKIFNAKTQKLLMRILGYLMTVSDGRYKAASHPFRLSKTRQEIFGGLYGPVPGAFDSLRGTVISTMKDKMS